MKAELFYLPRRWFLLHVLYENAPCEVDGCEDRNEVNRWSILTRVAECGCVVFEAGYGVEHCGAGCGCAEFEAGC